MVESEGKSNLGFALDAFKRHNENWEKIRCVMTDKDITEGHYLRKISWKIAFNMPLSHSAHFSA